MLRHTALIGAHRELGAKLVGFGGWEMPLSYRDGTLAEHRACREDAVVFDVSHLGTVRLDGPGTLRAAAGRAQQRSAQGGAGSCPVLAPARRRGRLGPRRRNRLVAR